MTPPATYRRRPVALTVAGTDSGGGAGVAADLKTFEAHHVWGTCAVTAVTAQNTRGVARFEAVAPQLVAAQIASVASDLGVDAAKTGMLPTAAVIEAAARAIGDAGITRLVVDPVLVATSGDRLAGEDTLAALRDALLPLASVVTPNLTEAAALVGFEVEDRVSMERAARALVAAGAGAALVTGGHLEGDRSPDCLVVAGRPEAVWIDGVRHHVGPVHGGGCVLSAALCAELARGMDVADASVAAKRFCERAIAAGVALGAGARPVDPGWERRGP